MTRCWSSAPRLLWNGSRISRPLMSVPRFLLPVFPLFWALARFGERWRAHDLVATSDEFLGASWAAAAGGGTASVPLWADRLPSPNGSMAPDG